jgi:putative Tat pathway signal sequence domain protein
LPTQQVPSGISAGVKMRIRRIKMVENTGLSRRKLLRTAAIGVPAAGAVAFGASLVAAPAANANIATSLEATKQAEAVQLHQEAREAADLANTFTRDSTTSNDPAAADLRDAAQKAEAAAQQLDQAIQASKDSDRDAANRLK